ncbi:MAG: efflux RND transporter permease subunit [Lewinellaceae bacterium]|nr:efflux RND transporter permease subunit [Lewinellaceae bacterium]
MSITEIAIKRPSLILVLFLVLTLLGLFSYTKLSYELIPKFEAPIITATTLYPGAGPAEVEQSITKKVEDALSGVEGVKGMRSTSRENLSTVIVELAQDANVDLALQDAQRKINAVQSTFPEDSRLPVLGKFSSDEVPIMNIGANANLSPGAFYDLAKDRIAPALASIDGVAQVSLVGGQEREVRINVNREQLEIHRLSMLQVLQAVKTANLEFPTGKVKNDNNQVTIRLAGKLAAIDQLRQLVVATNPVTRTPIRLGEIAEVEDATKEAADLSRVNGVAALGILIQKQSDANAVAVSETVRDQMARLSEIYTKEELRFEVSNDTSDFTITAVDAVIHDISLAVVLVAVIMLLFLHSFRNALIVMLAIPTSLISTMILMYAFGFSLNLMTLLAMSLVIGILVDDSIVVLENIYRHLEMGKDRRKAALDGRNEIGFTALAITLVDVVVFFPIALTGGIVGNIMRQFALVVVMSTLMSLLVSFTLTPMLASRFSRLEHLHGRNLLSAILLAFERGLEALTARYVGALKWSIRHWYAVLGITVVLFFSSFQLVTGGFIGTAFISTSDRGEFIIKLELPKEATLAETNRVSQEAEDYLLEKGDVIGVFSTIGRTTDFFTGGTSLSNTAELQVKLTPAEQRDISTDFYARNMKNELEMRLPGTKVTSSPVSFFGGADQEPIQVIVSSADLDEAKIYGDSVLNWLRNTPGAMEAKLSYEVGNPEILVEVDRARMAELGLDLGTVGATMQTAFSGNTDTKFRDGNSEYDINIRLDEFDRRNADDVRNLTFINQQGQLVKLTQFAKITPTTGPSILERKDRIPAVTVSSKVLGRQSGDIGADLQAKIAQNPPPAGVAIAYDGDLKAQEESFGSLGLAFLASIIFVYLIMVALYDSWVSPFVVLFSIPVAMVGAFLSMALSMSTLDIFSILGIIMLVGLVGKNAILLVDFANQRKREGYRLIRAILEAGALRLRPIIMTTIAMVIGMLPIALATGPGAEWKNGLAWALIGGLTSSMLLTLVVVPIIYLMMERVRRWATGERNRIRAKREADKAAREQRELAMAD